MTKLQSGYRTGSASYSSIPARSVCRDSGGGSALWRPGSRPGRRCCRSPRPPRTRPAGGRRGGRCRHTGIPRHRLGSHQSIGPAQQSANLVQQFTNGWFHFVIRLVVDCAWQAFQKVLPSGAQTGSLSAGQTQPPARHVRPSGWVRVSDIKSANKQ